MDLESRERWSDVEPSVKTVTKHDGSTQFAHQLEIEIADWNATASTGRDNYSQLAQYVSAVLAPRDKPPVSDPE